MPLHAMRVLAATIALRMVSSAPECPAGSIPGSHGVPACCPTACGHCGGRGCEERDGGRQACCALDVQRAGHSCNDTAPPCVPERNIYSRPRQSNIYRCRVAVPPNESSGWLPGWSQSAWGQRDAYVTQRDVGTRELFRCAPSPRVAVLLYGAVRNVEHSRPSFDVNVFAPLEAVWTGGVDAFVHALLSPAINNRRSGEHTSAPLRPDRFARLGPACRYSAEDQDLVDVTEVNASHLGALERNAFRMWYSLSRAASLARAHERSDGFEYEFIATVRSDTAILTPLTPAIAPLRASPASIVLPNTQHWFGLNNRFAFGGRTIMMKVYTRQWDHAKRWRGRGNTESFLCRVLDQHDVRMVFVDLCVVRVRANGGCLISDMWFQPDQEPPPCARRHAPAIYHSPLRPMCAMGGYTSSDCKLQDPVTTVRCPPLTSEFAQPGTAPRTPPSASEPSLSSLLKSSGSDKASHHAYDVVYEGLFAPFRDRPIQMLEIGVEDGHSLDVWSKYFASGSKIFGLAYHNKLKENVRDNVTIFHGSQGDASVLDRLVGAGNFSIIIDDGSHLPSHQWNTFQTLWNTVTPGGVYVVEDIETNYWSKKAVIYGYPLMHEKNAMDDFKRLVDNQVNAEFSRGVDDTDMQWIQFYKNCVIMKKHGLSHSKRTYRYARWRLPAEALRTASSAPECPAGSIPGSHGVPACCPTACGHCGGRGCEERDGGRQACCALDVQRTGHSCNDTAPPCVPERNIYSRRRHRCFAPFLLNSPERRCAYCTLVLGGRSDACECNGSGVSSAQYSTASPAAFSDESCPASVRVRGTLLVHFGREAANSWFLGFVNQLAELSHHLALACEMGDNLAFTGFYKDLSSRSSPDSMLVPLPLLVDVADLNTRLARDPRCTRTQVLSSGCAAHLALRGPILSDAICSDTTIPHGLSTVHANRVAFADEILALFKPRSPLPWSPESKRTRLSSTDQDRRRPEGKQLPLEGEGVRAGLQHGYTAVHLDLEADRLIFRAFGPQGYRRWLEMDQAQKVAYIEECCGPSGSPRVVEVANFWLERYFAAIDNELRRDANRQIVVLTALGKGFHGTNASTWVLGRFLKRMDQIRARIVLGHTSSSFREVAAASELAVASRATTFVGSSQSTFSRFAAIQVALTGGRALLLCAKEEMSNSTGSASNDPRISRRTMIMFSNPNLVVTARVTSPLGHHIAVARAPLPPPVPRGASPRRTRTFLRNLASHSDRSGGTSSR